MSCVIWVTPSWKPPFSAPVWLCLSCRTLFGPVHPAMFPKLPVISTWPSETLEAIVGGPISDWSWRKASLPSSLGGVNLRSASLHAPAAFVASSAQSQDLVESMLGLPSCHPPPPRCCSVSFVLSRIPTTLAVCS